MAVNILLKRSSTASKRPVGSSMASGELNLNFDAATSGLYFKDSSGAVVKVGPCQVSATAPNSSPAGSAGNSAGEFWYDTSTTTLKVYDGANFVETGGSVQGVTGTAPISVDNTDPLNPVISASAASTSATGVVQLNDTTSSTSATEALTANQGRNLQEQINALAVTSNLTFAGTLNASTGFLATVTAEGTGQGFVVGSVLPSPVAANAEFFVITSVGSASYTPPGGSPTLVHIGDWFLSSGSAWELLDVGFQAPYATTTDPGIVELATDAEVQAGTDTTLVVTPAALQSKLTDQVASTSSTQIASAAAVKTAFDAAVAADVVAVAAGVAAGLAQGDATQALTDAAAAQGDATQALTDAAAAQTTADAAVPDASFLAAGDLLVGSGAGTYAALSAGPSDYILSSDGVGGLAWVAQLEGDVTTVSGTAPIAVDNTDPQNPVVSVGAASTSVAGVVQLNDTVISTSITEAATARAVKEAYDAAYEDPLIAYNTLSVNPTYGDNATGARGTGHAFSTLTAALAAALDGDFIFMAPGTYTENPIINKGVTILGTFHDQGTWQGTKILGNTQLNLTSAVTRNCSINNIYFISPNSTPVFTVTAHSTSAGNTIISDCGFTQATATDVNQFAFLSPAATWVRAIYARNCLFDGNVKHNAGTAAGASGYFVMDNTIGAGSSSFYYHILTGTVEFRSPTQALSPIFQTGGVVAATNVLGVTNNSATTTTIFGGTGFNYKGSAASVGTGIISFAGGSNVTGGKVAIGANLVYRWGNLHVTPANLTIDPTAVPITTQIPATANIIVAQQTRPRFDLLTTTSSVAAANQLATVLDSADGTLYTVAALDAGVF